MEKENGLLKYEDEAYISRFNGGKTIKINKTQFNALKQQLASSDIRFVRVGNRIINVNDIREVSLVPKKVDTNIYQEKSSNPLYREWVTAGEPLKDFKRWLNER